MMLTAECRGPDSVLINSFCAETHYNRRVSVADARRFAAELLVAAERAERLERDMRAPG